MDMAAHLHGILPILVTPFHPDGRIDEASLARLVEALIGAGVHGLGFALASEIFKLSEDERDQATRCIVGQAAGRVPVVVNTGANGSDLAVQYSRRAEALGADAVMVMPPAFLAPTPDETLSYFRAISDAITIPIVIQDTPATPVGPALAARIGAECAQARYIKVEGLPLPGRVAEMAAVAGGTLIILGGAAGNFVLEEFRRGSVGTMPGCAQAEEFVALWNLSQAGEWAAAERLFLERVLPLNRLAAGGLGAFYHAHKRLLVRRGLIDDATVRGPTTPLDPATSQELDALLDRLLAQPLATALDESGWESIAPELSLD
jgi:4-hydroxy-tetrahydrodipicolinate synthase